MARASGNGEQDGVAIGFGQRLADASGDHPRGMDALAAQSFDDALAKLAQADAIERKLRVFLGHAKDIAGRRIGVHPEKQSRARTSETGSGHATA